MSSRPRRSAAVKAHEAITDWIDSERPTTMSTRSRRSDGRPSGVSRDPPSSPGNDSQLNLTVKVPSGRLREATAGRSRDSGTSVAGARESRNRGAKKSYVVESDSDEDEDEEMEDLGDFDEEDMEEADAEGEDDDEDAQGDLDADGDVEMDASTAEPHHSTIKIQNPKASSGKVAPRRPAAARRVEDEDDDDEEELSEIEVSDPENTQEMSINVLGDGVDDDEGEEEDEEEDEGEEDEEEEEEDAEGEDDAEVEEDETQLGDDAGPDAAEEAGGGGLDSDDEGDEDKEVDITKMTRRQRARFEDTPQDYMKLSDEVQAKKVFTAEELSMRRQEMARRRRNLSEKRNEEVKMETINKLLKKQAPKTNKKGAAAAAAKDPATKEANDELSEDAQRPAPTFVRWTNTKQGSRVGVPGEMVRGPAGKLFGGGMRTGKMVEEVQ